VTVFSPAVAPVLRRLVDTPISLRELEVIDASADGLSYAGVGELLGLSVAGVKSHLGRVSTRLAIPGRAGLVGYCYLRGLLVRVPSSPVYVNARQREVLPHVAYGLEEAQIAERMDVTLSAAHEYLRGAAKAHGARTRAHLVRLSVNAGTLPLTATVRVAEVAA
jgi:DNA-binding CsgD family transcriptional regulator